jgi:hypothetical protein
MDVQYTDDVKTMQRFREMVMKKSMAAWRVPPMTFEAAAWPDAQVLSDLDPRVAHALAAAVAIYKNTRVTKKLSPLQPGARKLARLYGDALVCVRYRQDMRGQYRYTTVELVVERMPVVRREDMNRQVKVRIGFQEIQLHQTARSQGAIWNDRSCLWEMPLKLAKKLGLLHRVVKE